MKILIGAKILGKYPSVLWRDNDLIAGDYKAGVNLLRKLFDKIEAFVVIV